MRHCFPIVPIDLPEDASKTSSPPPARTTYTLAAVATRPRASPRPVPSGPGSDATRGASQSASPVRASTAASFASK